ncbi:MAG: hypothetical protein M3Q03_01985 [Chloroflexota bacterium]|nr:hypothetical protein [Chloroflexota bacterium]
MAAALGRGGRVLGTFVGQRLAIYPAGFSTTCLARAAVEPELKERAVAILQRLSYYGIAEVEFLRDPRDGVFKLLDVNQRPWKWIGLPIAAGVDLPWLAYAETTGEAVGMVERRDDMLWVSVKDYVPLRACGEAMQVVDPLGKDLWLAPTDPEPFYRAIQSAFGEGATPAPAERT